MSNETQPNADFRNYLRSIGKRGGSSKSEAKLAASKANLEKARAAKAQAKEKQP